MDNKKIGEFIKNIRKNNNLTQKEFADRYNVTFQAVSKWENGKNIPDISLLKEICKDYDISIDELLEGKESSKMNNYFIIGLIIFILIIILGIILFLYFGKNNNFEFKTISTTCDNFNITGSAAYNKNKSSIYISNIEFCGDEDNLVYKELDYVLYENYDNTNIEISSGNKRENISLVDYLRELKINVDNYSQTCKKFNNSNLYLEINAIDEDDKITTYKIPISLDDNCK